MERYALVEKNVYKKTKYVKIIPKQKSDVQFNGYEKFELSWSIPHATSVNKEFNERYNKLIKDYEELASEVYWNTLIYNIEIKFKPVIGKSYYLYVSEGEYFLSLISPNEWKRYFVGEFKFNHNGKWEKI